MIKYDAKTEPCSVSRLIISKLIYIRHVDTMFMGSVIFVSSAVLVPNFLVLYFMISEMSF